MHDKRRHKQNELVYWCKVLTCVVVALYALYAGAHALHVYTHALERNRKMIASEREFVETFCSNDTLVHATRRNSECEFSRDVVSRDASAEAFFETMASLHICSTTGDPHRLDNGMHSGDVHCPHKIYLVAGAASAFAVMLLAVCCCRAPS